MSENRKCPSCGASLDLNANECRYCGQAMEIKSSGMQNIQSANGQIKIQYNDSQGQAVEYGQPQYNQQPQQRYNNPQKVKVKS